MSSEQAEHYVQEKLFIGGEWVAPIDGEVAASIDPSTGKEWARIAFGGPQDIDRAVAAAQAALHGPWGRMSGTERAAVLRRLGALIEERWEHLAQLETRDNGLPIRDTRVSMKAQAQWFYYFAGMADKIDGRAIANDRNVHAFTTRVPVGVVGAILPWNAPMQMISWKTAPALAAGCTLVIKPAEQTPVTAAEFARIAIEAGVPPGVINIVSGYGATAGAHLAGHPGVNKISFTGEHTTAQEIMKKGLVNMKRFTFECGGKSPHILFEDADLAQAMNAATHSAFAFCGQSCALGSRLLVQRSIYARVVDELAQRARRIRIGQPLDAATQMGPQAHAEQLAKTLRYIDIGSAEGAQLVSGGKRLSQGAYGDGYFVEPTVFANVRNDMRVAREEIFGPVVSVIPFDDEEQALEIANDTRYGLVAGLWTRDIGRAHRVASQIQAGTVWVNTYRHIRWNIPYGGIGISGMGRENGPEVIDYYTETRATIIGLTGEYPDYYAQ
jgi:acyl-CoA reductase-like NAD-dependent aldehyde dehydrogenase